MILGPIYTYREFRHIETGRIVKVQEPDRQVKLAPVDKPIAVFVVDVDSFRRKFTEVTAGDIE